MAQLLLCLLLIMRDSKPGNILGVTTLGLGELRSGWTC